MKIAHKNQLLSLASLSLITLFSNSASADSNTIVEDCESNPCKLAWVGNSHSWPYNGQIESTDDLWFNIETYPIIGDGFGSYGFNYGVEVEFIYTLDGENWQSAPMSKNGTVGNNQKWHINLGKNVENTVVD